MYALFGKRLFDIVIALIAVMVLLPVLFLIAILIKATDPGPVFFVQMRIGKEGRVFRLYKFRSMPVGTVDAPSDEIGEVRLSSIGKFIRRTNLDEVPQLLNILVGDMSVVGPRPPVPQQTELVKLRRESCAIFCRPGLTGLAQVNSYDGMSVAAKAKYDAEYADKITFWRDILIVLRTVSYLFKKPPVY